MARSLYICYFGMREPLVQTQVLSYIRELVKDGHEITLLTFEPANSELEPQRAAELRRSLADEQIDWHTLRYHKRLSVIATAYDIFRGALFARRMIGRKQLDILHARVHVPAVMAALARKFSRRKPKILFDIRGFMPEEYTDAGVWPENGLLYRAAKRVESWLLKESDGFVVLTEKARDILFPGARETGVDRRGRPVEVIPCCVDFSRFDSAGTGSREDVRREYGLNGRFVMVYVGAFGGWYLTRETADLFGVLKKKVPDAFALVLTQSPPEQIEGLLGEHGYGKQDMLVTRVPPSDIPRYLSAADAAVSFIKECYSKQASSPTKNAEYLASGLPMVANAGVGDVDVLIQDNNVGALVREMSAEGYSSALDTLEKLGDVSARCRITSREQFDLEQVGGVRYRRLYRRLLER